MVWDAATRELRTALSETYCQIYCQKRGGEGIPGDGKLRVFSKLLIFIYVAVASTSRRATSAQDAGAFRDGGPERE